MKKIAVTRLKESPVLEKEIQSLNTPMEGSAPRAPQPAAPSLSPRQTLIYAKGQQCLPTGLMAAFQRNPFGLKVVTTPSSGKGKTKQVTQPSIANFNFNNGTITFFCHFSNNFKGNKNFPTKIKLSLLKL